MSRDVELKEIYLRALRRKHTNSLIRAKMRAEIRRRKK